MAKLKLVSITGADDGVNPKELAALSRDFPFVEWAFLFSRNSSGEKPRYPSLRWMKEACEQDIRVAVHLCGDLARKMAAGDGRVMPTVKLLCESAERVQLNIHPYGIHLDSAHTSWLEHVAYDFGMQIILPTKSFQTWWPRNSACLRNGPGGELPAIGILHDASGGRGIVGPFEAPLDGEFVGYAGGLGPDNVIDKVREIEALGFAQDYWIDMESGVRNEHDEFVFAKARAVLEAVAPFVEAS